MTLEEMFNYGEQPMQEEIVPETQVPEVSGPEDGPGDDVPTSFKGNFEKKPVGGTKEEKDKKTPLYDINTGYINTLNSEVDQLDFDYVTRTFEKLGRLPVVDKKEYQLSELREVMKDSNKKGKLLKIADELQEDPTLDADARWENIYNRSTSAIKLGQTAFFAKKLNGEMYNAAKRADAALLKQSAFKAARESLFSSDGRLLSKKEYGNRLSKIVKQKMDEWDKMHPELPAQPMNFIEQPGMRSDMSSFLQPVRFRDEEGRMVSRSNVYNPLGLSPIQRRQMERSDYLNQLNATYSSKFYDKYVQEVVNFYNDPKGGSSDFVAAAENKFKQNKGGEKQAVEQSFGFDFHEPKLEIYNEETGEYTYKVKPEIKEFSRINKLLNGSDAGKIMINVGGVSESPSSKDLEKQEIVRLMNSALGDATDKHTKKKPYGDIVFQGIVAGGELDYHAYTIKFKENYLNQSKFKGTEKDPKIVQKYPKILTEGFTIYVPADISSTKTSTGRAHRRASTTSSVEMLLNTTNNIDINIPKGGNLHLRKDDETGQITASGYVVDYNPESGRYDTTRLVSETFPYDAATDIDAIVIDDYLKGLFKDKYYLNIDTENKVRGLRGVKDPSKL